MNHAKPPRGPFTLKFFVTGLCLLGIALCMCFGGGLMVYRSIMLSTHGVIGEAIVQEHRGEVTTRRRNATFRNQLYLLAFDGRTLERQLPDEYQVGDKLEIIYVPGTVNMELVKDRLPLWQAVPIGLALILAGVFFGWFGYAFSLDGLGIVPAKIQEAGAGNSG